MLVHQMVINDNTCLLQFIGNEHVLWFQLLGCDSGASLGNHIDIDCQGEMEALYH